MCDFSAALRHCEEARRSNPENKLMVWIASFLAMTVPRKNSINILPVTKKVVLLPPR